MLMINCYVPHPVLSSGVTLLGVGSREREREREKEREGVYVSALMELLIQ
jgi:hypothetical protein